jgi:hypothetical protein
VKNTEEMIENDVESPDNTQDSTSEIYDPSKLNVPEKERLTDWKNEPSIESLKGDLEFARQENTDQKGNVDGWISLRNATGSESGKKTKAPGRSSVQPKLIRKHNEWRYPALSEPFLNSDRMFNINPRTFEDKAAADQNQMILNWQFDTKLNKVDFIDRFVRKTVDEGTCVVRVGWERKTERVKVLKPIFDYYPMDMGDEEGMQILAQATEMAMADPEAFEADPNIPESLRAAVVYGLENQEMVVAEEVGEEWVEETKITWNQPSLKIVNVANFFIDPSCEGEWNDAQYMIHTYESTKSELKKRKIYKNLDDVNWGANTIKAQTGDPDHETTTPIPDGRLNSDKAKVLVYEYWGLWDIHGDGEMLPIVATFIGDTMIQLTENPFPDKRPPFVIVPYMPILGSVWGEADASLLQDNQRILGAVTRGTIDLLGRSANAQAGYSKGFLDPVNTKRFKAGEDFEFNPNQDPRVAIQQLQYPEIPNSALTMMQLQNAEAEGLSGVKSFSGGITGEAYGRVARGISGALDAAGQREMSILRRLAEGMRLIGRKIMAMNAFFLEEKEVIRVTNKEFVTIRRDDLVGNFDLIVDISTAQVDEQKSQDLGMMLQTMGPDMDPGLSKIILAEIADLKRMPHLAEMIRAYEPQPDPMQQEMQRLQIADLEAEIELKKARAMEAMAGAENKALDTEMEKTGQKHAQAVEKMGAQAAGNRDLEVTKALTKGETPGGQIEAAVGFNKLMDDLSKKNASPQEPLGRPPMEQPTMPMAPLRSAPNGVVGGQDLAFPQ